MTISSASPSALALLAQPAGVFQRGLGVVDRAGPDHDGEAVVGAVQDAVQRLRAARVDRGRRHARCTEFAHQLGGRAQLA